MGEYFYLIGAFVLIVAVFRAKSFKAKNISNSALVNGSVKGSVTQTVTVSPPLSSPPAGDRVAWVIGIIGVLIMAGQFSYDVFFTK
ncbi:hypothetical protein [Pararhodospirillum photometricum]|uniref:hypothetical protein n=1 Tax=Pararhodospirillum photometricum TaxID=1084 RepID=UPI0002FCF5DC|nr:hypothetical protein [Pararhodospirillum photometricum]